LPDSDLTTPDLPDADLDIDDTGVGEYVYLPP
jgi:hypothetical protein